MISSFRWLFVLLCFSLPKQATLATKHTAASLAKREQKVPWWDKKVTPARKEKDCIPIKDGFGRITMVRVCDLSPADRTWFEILDWIKIKDTKHNKKVVAAKKKKKDPPPEAPPAEEDAGERSLNEAKAEVQKQMAILVEKYGLKVDEGKLRALLAEGTVSSLNEILALLSEFEASGGKLGRLIQLDLFEDEDLLGGEVGEDGLTSAQFKALMKQKLEERLARERMEREESERIAREAELEAQEGARRLEEPVEEVEAITSVRDEEQDTSSPAIEDVEDYPDPEDFPAPMVEEAVVEILEEQVIEEPKELITVADVMGEIQELQKSSSPSLLDQVAEIIDRDADKRGVDEQVKIIQHLKAIGFSMNFIKMRRIVLIKMILKKNPAIIPVMRDSQAAASSCFNSDDVESIGKALEGKNWDVVEATQVAVRRARVVYVPNKVSFGGDFFKQVAAGFSTRNSVANLMRKTSKPASAIRRPGRLHESSPEGVMNSKQFGSGPGPLPPPKHFTGGASYLQLFKPSVPSCVQQLPPCSLSAPVHQPCERSVPEEPLLTERGRPTPRGAQLKVGSSESSRRPDPQINTPAGSPHSQRPRGGRWVSLKDPVEENFKGLPLVSSPLGLPQSNIHRTPRRSGGPAVSSSSRTPSLVCNGYGRKQKQQPISARGDTLEQSKFDEHAAVLQVNVDGDPMWESITSRLGPASERPIAPEVPTLETCSSNVPAYPGSRIVVPKIKAGSTQNKPRGISQYNHRPRAYSHSSRLDAIEGPPREVKPSSITRCDAKTAEPRSVEGSPRIAKPLYLAALEVGVEPDAAKSHPCPPLTSRSTSKASSSCAPPEPSSASHPSVLSPLSQTEILAPRNVVTLQLGPNGDEIQHAGEVKADHHRSSTAIKRRSKSPVELRSPAGLDSGDDMLVGKSVSPKENLSPGSELLSDRTVGNQHGKKHQKSVSASPKTRKLHNLDFLSPTPIGQPDDSLRLSPYPQQPTEKLGHGGIVLPHISSPVTARKR